MRHPMALTLFLLLLTGPLASAQRQTVTFEDAPVGHAPRKFDFSVTLHRAAPWHGLRDGMNTVMVHTPHKPGGLDFAAFQDAHASDIEVSVKFRFPHEPQTAGLVWRYRDAEHHYAVAVDLRAQNVRTYRVNGGTRTRLESLDGLELDPAAWHSLKVRHEGTRMRIWIDGVPLADISDRTPPPGGAVGVWTPSEAHVWFDDLHVEPLRQAARGEQDG